MEKAPWGAFHYACGTKNGLDVVRKNDNNIVSVVSDKVGVYLVQKIKWWSRWWEKGGHWPATPDQTLQQDRIDRNVKSTAICSKKCSWPIFAFIAFIVAFSKPIQPQAHVWSAEQDQRSSRHLPHDWKSVPRLWSSSTIPETSNRFCCISTHGSWTDPLWQAGPPRSAQHQRHAFYL